jgi:protoporphyrinogen oxidase
MNNGNPIAILGGGLAGLAVGHYAAKRGCRFSLYEAGSEVGGNCRTFRHENFLFDSGAHRFHDKDAAITAEVRELLGQDLLRGEIPSVIYREGQLIDFPLSPFNLLRRLGLRMFLKAAGEVLACRWQGRPPAGDLETFAIQAYGPTMAHLFLLDYSRKLWGMDCGRLSANATGKRLKGLSLRTFLTEAFLGRRVKTRHLDGAFLYPRHGIGTIADRLRDSCGPANIRLQARITRILHDGRWIQAFEVNGNKRVEADHVVTTLPLSAFIQQMEPAPPEEILALAGQIRFRSLILVALFLSAPRITKFGTVYFPDPTFPFTRVYEPKNRSPHMAPPDQTSLMAEIPCQESDAIWQTDDGELIQRVRSHLLALGWFQNHQILEGRVMRLKHAYPVLEKGIESQVARASAYLASFQNLTQCGRNAMFLHASIHDVIRQGRDLGESLPAAVC